MGEKKHFGKKAFVKTFFGIVLILFFVKTLFPSLLLPHADKEAEVLSPSTLQLDSIALHARYVDSLMSQPHCLPVDLSRTPTTTLHCIWSVSSYERAFPDLNDVQMATAERLGNPPVKDRQEASRFGHDKLVYVGGNPFYHVKKLDNSIPYLVPRAQLLLTYIARTFIDSLLVKKIRPSQLIVTSLTRTREDVDRLRSHNPNASERSCHCMGTTFDISYTKYYPIQDPEALPVRQTRDDTLRWVLSEVLQDARRQGLCYVKYERKQGCYHITAR